MIFFLLYGMVHVFSCGQTACFSLSLGREKPHKTMVHALAKQAKVTYCYLFSDLANVLIVKEHSQHSLQ